MTRFKFEQWFPYFRHVLDSILEDDCEERFCYTPAANCAVKLQRYRNADNGLHATSHCEQVYDCLSEGLLPNEASNFQSAEVLLGLAPTLLTTIAPSLGEICLLSTHRKLLALLLAVGNPSINVSRLLSYDDPREYLKRGYTAFGRDILNLTGHRANIALAIQYAVAAGAIVNVVELSWELGFRTVIAWKCNASYIPFVWTVMPLFIHILAAAGWHVSTDARMIRQSDTATTHEGLSMWTKLRKASDKEFQVPSQRSRPKLSADQQPSKGKDRLALFLNELAGCGAFLHLLFGTTVFSSLMFISVIDALQVIARYIGSGLACRLVVNWELAAMRAMEQSHETKDDKNIPLVATPLTGTAQRRTF